MVTAYRALQFNLRISNDSGPLPLGYALGHSRGHHADAWNWRGRANNISFIGSVGGEAAERHASNVVRDGSRLRRTIFGFNGGDVGAQSRGNRGADRSCARLLEGNGRPDRAGCSLVCAVDRATKRRSKKRRPPSRGLVRARSRWERRGVVRRAFMVSGPDCFGRLCPQTCTTIASLVDEREISSC